VPVRCTVPPAGRPSPASTRASVVLPAPFRPTRPILSPGPTWKLAASISNCAPARNSRPAATITRTHSPRIRCLIPRNPDRAASSPQAPGRTPHSSNRRTSGTTQPQAPQYCPARLRHDVCPGAEDQPPAPPSSAPPARPNDLPAGAPPARRPAREADELRAAVTAGAAACPQAYPLVRRPGSGVSGGRAAPVPPATSPRGGCARSTTPLTVAVHRPEPSGRRRGPRPCRTSSCGCGVMTRMSRGGR
jgi:hypothetical protein